MKKILLIIRKGFDADYICSHLPDGYDFTVIEETGKVAKKKKLKRMLKRKRNMLLSLADLIALFIYDAYETSKIKKICKVSDLSNFHKCGNISDVNDPSVSINVEKIQPDLIIIYGTGIVRQTTLSSTSVDFFNIHSSVLPAYRNVHSDFWAYYNKDFEKIGLTIFKLSVGIDTGDIALQTVSDLPIGSRLHEYKAWNLIHVPVLMGEFLKSYFEGSFSYAIQDEAISSRYKTPTIGNFFMLIKNYKIRASKGISF